MPIRFEVEGNWGVVGGKGQIPLGHFEKFCVAFVYLLNLRLLRRGKVRADVDVVDGKGDDADGLVDVGVGPTAQVNFRHVPLHVLSRERQVGV